VIEPNQARTQAKMLTVFPLATTENKRWSNHCYSLGPEADPGEVIGAITPLKPTKVTFFTMILYNSERHLTAN